MEKMGKIEAGYDYRGLGCAVMGAIMAHSWDPKEISIAFWTSVNLGCEAA